MLFSSIKDCEYRKRVIFFVAVARVFLIKLFPQPYVCAKPYFAARTGNIEDRGLKGEDGWAVLASSQLTHFPLQATLAKHRDFSFCMRDQQSVLPEGGHGSSLPDM